MNWFIQRLLQSNYNSHNSFVIILQRSCRKNSSFVKFVRLLAKLLPHYIHISVITRCFIMGLYCIYFLDPKSHVLISLVLMCHIWPNKCSVCTSFFPQNSKSVIETAGAWSLVLIPITSIALKPKAHKVITTSIASKSKAHNVIM